MEISGLTIEKAHQGLVKKEFSAQDLCQSYLAEIEKKNKEIFAYLTVAEKEAIFQAKKVDKLISKKKEISILAGIPFAIKDNILVKGLPCTAGSKILENYIAPYDATCIKRLKAEGAVILGKTNLDEFAMGSSCEYSAFGPTKNPCDLERVPGGSSGGSAAAVAANLALAALGSDTGGSIRQPASFCGVVGLKPTYGAVSRYGLIAMASSLDQIGPIAKCVKDAKIIFEKISGKDLLDATSVELKLKKREEKLKIEELKIGVPKEYFIKGIDEEVENLFQEALEEFEEIGVKIEEISLPHTAYALPTYYIIMPAEVSANLARYDGIKYGKSFQKSKPKNLLEVYLKTREKGFGDEPKRRIMLGTFALSHGYYEAYYLRAQKVRRKIREDFEKAFEKVDLIFTPTAPTPAFKIGEIQDPLQMYLADIFTVSINLAGLPAISIPCGKIRNLPVGLQIIGNFFEEEKILMIGEIFERIKYGEKY